MKSLISEFSYGFALTHELILSIGTLKAAPIFPSLIEEGKAGGGYGVKLDAPGIPLFLQFKRSECLSRPSAREIKAGASLSIPFYRAEITGKADSQQHEMLLVLDQAPNFVFYAAPMFHKKDEFDAAFLGGVVRQRSFFVRPTKIGSFTDNKPHYLSFDGNQCVVMSEPKLIEAYGAVELEGMLKEQLASDERPLRQTIDEAVQKAEEARTRVRDRLATLTQEEDEEDTVPEISGSDDDRPPSELFRERQERTIPPAPLPALTGDPQRESLRRLADIGLREFNAQLYIVQSKADP